MAESSVLARLQVVLGLDPSQLQEGVKQSLSDVGKFGDSMANTGKKLSMSVTAPLVAIGGAALATTVRVGNMADKLLDLSEQTGLSTDTLQEFRHVATMAGVPSDTLANSAIKLTAALSGSGAESAQLTDAMGELGVNFRDATGELLPMDALLPDIIKSLQSQEDATTRNALAADIFGRSWADLAPVLALGEDGIQGARDAAHDLGLVLSKDSLDAANEFRQKWDTLKTVMGGAAAQIGIELVPIMSALAGVMMEKVVPGVQSVIRIVRGLTDRWNELSPATQKFLGTVVGLAAAIGPVLVVGGKMLALIAGLNPVTVLAVGALAAVVAAGVAVTENWNVLSFEAKRLIDWIAEQFGRLTAIFDTVKAGTEKVVGFFRGMFDVVVGNSIIPDMVDGIGGEFGRLDDVMVGAAERAAARTNQAFREIVNPKALRSLDFNVTLDAEQLYATVIAGGAQAGASLFTLATRTEIARAATADFGTNMAENIRVARDLADEHRALQIAEAAAERQMHLLAQIVGLEAIPGIGRTVPALSGMTTASDMAKLSLAALEPVVEAATTKTSLFGSIIDGTQSVVGAAGTSLKGALSTLGGGALDLLGKLTPMGFAADLVQKVFKELEPAIQALEPIIVILAKALAAGLTPIIKALFPVFKLVAQAATFVGEVFFRIAQGITWAIGNLIKGLGHAIDSLPFVSGKGIIKAGEDLLGTSKEFGGAAKDLKDARKEIGALEWPEEAAEAAKAQTEAIVGTKEATEAATVAIREEAGVLTTLLEVSRTGLDRIYQAVQSLEMSPQINVTVQGGGGLAITSGSGGGDGFLSRMNAGLGSRFDFDERMSGRGDLR